MGGSVRGGAMGVVGCAEGDAPLDPGGLDVGRGRVEGEAGGRAVTDTGTSVDTPPTDTRITAPPMPVALMAPRSSTDAAAGLLDTNVGLKASAGAGGPAADVAGEPVALVAPRAAVRGAG